MPLIRLTASVPMDAASHQLLTKRLTDIIAGITDKDEDYVMVLIDHAAGGMGGHIGPVAFVDVRGIGGLYDAVNSRISAAVCKLLQEELAIPPDCVYLNFCSVRAYNWGWNGQTFG
jgi:phenylpyruvate tautomerase